MHYSLGEAAKAAGVAKSTISKALASGKLSCVEKVGNAYRIDPAELHRVFPKPPETRSETIATNERERPENAPETAGNAAVLEVRLEGLAALMQEKDRRIADLEADRDEWRNQARTLALTDQRTKPPSLFERLFGLHRSTAA